MARMVVREAVKMQKRTTEATVKTQKLTTEATETTEADKRIALQPIRDK
jgi:hypothetical protein